MGLWLQRSSGCCVEEEPEGQRSSEATPWGTSESPDGWQTPRPGPRPGTPVQLVCGVTLASEVTQVCLRCVPFLRMAGPGESLEVPPQGTSAPGGAEGTWACRKHCEPPVTKAFRTEAPRVSWPGASGAQPATAEVRTVPTGHRYLLTALDSFSHHPSLLSAHLLSHRADGGRNGTWGRRLAPVCCGCFPFSSWGLCGSTLARCHWFTAAEATEPPGCPRLEAHQRREDAATQW